MADKGETDADAVGKAGASPMAKVTDMVIPTPIENLLTMRRLPPGSAIYPVNRAATQGATDPATRSSGRGDSAPARAR